MSNTNRYAALTPPPTSDEDDRFYGDHVSEQSYSEAPTSSKSDDDEAKALRLEMLQAQLEKLLVQNEDLRRALDASKEEALAADHQRFLRAENVVVVEEGAVVDPRSAKGKEHAAKLPADPSQPGARAAKIKLDYTLGKSSRSWLKERFPTVAWETSTIGSHDHPCAHAETVLATRQAQRKLPLGSVTLDLYGSPTSNEAFNKSQKRGDNPKRIDSLVYAFTEKDYLRRATKWGPERDAEGNPRYAEEKLGAVIAQQLDDGRGVLEHYDQLLSVHTLYYLSQEEIVRAVNGIQDKGVLTAVFHRHAKSEGFLFNKEVYYTKDEAGVVKQVNRETGEYYVHPSLDWLFDSQTKVIRCDDGSGKLLAAVWTLEKFTDDTWIAQFTACPATMDEGFVNRLRITEAQYYFGVRNEVERVAARKAAIQRLNVDDADLSGVLRVKVKTAPDVLRVQTGTVVRAHGFVTLAFPGADRDLKITNEEFFTHLRQQCVGVPRTEKSLANLYAVARRSLSGSSYPGAGKYAVDVADVPDHVCGAFLADVDAENIASIMVAVNASKLRLNRELGVEAVHAHSANSVGAITGPLLAGSRIAKQFGKSRLATLVEGLVDR